MKILVIHGPNLNMLGIRETKIYGNKTLPEINTLLEVEAQDLAIHVDITQSNCEGTIINHIQGAYGKYDGIILNAGAYTHTSVGIRDAIAAVQIPTVEVHLSNTSKRENFRQKSYLTPVCMGKIEGFGHYSYLLALHAFANWKE